MTRRVVLERHAEEDLDKQAAFIARDNPAEALAFLDAVEQAFARLIDYPNIGSARAFRNTRLEGIRMWTIPECPNRLIFYPLPTMPCKSYVSCTLHRTILGFSGIRTPETLVMQSVPTLPNRVPLLPPWEALENQRLNFP